MIVGEYLDKVMQCFVVHDPSDIPLIEMTVSQLFHKGLTVTDAIRYCKCFEEVSPDLDEEKALAKMSAILAKYGAKPN